MINLSVNINKVATLRNARGENNPDVLAVACDCERFGADGITVHPRPDERHIRRSDVFGLRPLVRTEFNIEGYPTEDFIELVMQVRPEQVTLVPDAPDALTSSSGWDCAAHLDFLGGVIDRFKSRGIRTSVFVDAIEERLASAAATGTDRIELYTKPYADMYATDREEAVKPFRECSIAAHKLGLGVNAGHDLSLVNLAYFCREMPYLNEVSIGHALICDALYHGLEKTISMYKNAIKR